MKKSVCLLFTLLFSIFVSTFLFAEQPIVKDIQAQAGKGGKINILWALPTKVEKPITKLLVYRDKKQISSYKQIENLKPIAELSGDSIGYTDSVSDFNDYFYAVVSVTDKTFDLILLSFNSTVTGVHVNAKTSVKEPEKIESEKLYPEGTLREKPLPFIDILDGLTEAPPENQIISDESLEATNSLITSANKKQPLLKLYVFEEDLVSPDAGDDYFLFEILKTTFVQKKYRQAITDLTRLTGTNINENTRNRAYFYIGESEYFLGNYENAVKYFIKVEQAFPVLCKKWLDSALSRI